jgi:hypothetical protein
MLRHIITPSLIYRTESAKDLRGKPISDGDKLHAYVTAVQVHYGLDVKSFHWKYADSLRAREEGMPDLREIVAFLASMGVHRYGGGKP